MAYNRKERFLPDPTPYTLLDPGAYQTERIVKLKTNKAPFLSSTKRNTQSGAKIWTHKIYNSDYPPRIPNCTAMMDKLPRFPYEALSKKDLEDILCRCGIDNVCECTSETEVEIEEVNCQGKARRRLFKGHPPKSLMGEGLSSPSKRDQGFLIRTDGSKKRLMKKRPIEDPPMYDAEVNYSTDFYQGCKWSRWTSTRDSKRLEAAPGPADYTITPEPTPEQICAEHVRALRRKTCKQLRFIEMVQQRNIREGQPGPAAYSPGMPKDPQAEYYGPKAKRFQEVSEVHPGPADHWLKRDFDLPETPLVLCHAKLPEPPFFGIKSQRFKTRKEEGPGPATYDPNDKFCNILNCSTAPFGSTAVRFKQTVEEDDDEDDEYMMVSNDEQFGDKSEKEEKCPTPTWEFKSKTIRIRPLVKKYNEPSPADLPQSRTKVERALHLQYIAPFYSSDGKLLPWNDWMPVYGKLTTPGPGYYNWEKPRCQPAVCQGPLFRTARFLPSSFQTPAPNEYDVGGGIETVLHTHNESLRSKIENQHKFHWKPPTETKKLTPQEKEASLIQKSIQLLEGGIFPGQKPAAPEPDDEHTIGAEGPKLLRCFLYKKQIKPTF